MNKIISIISDKNLEYFEKKTALAYAAESLLDYPEVTVKSLEYIRKGIICDIFEGHAPYRPRYVLPDYQKFLKNGSAYLNIQAPKDLYDAINSLLIIYRYVPSITGYPVYLGGLDDLLEPFVDTVTENEATNLIKFFFTNIDRTMPDAFVHANIGPHDSKIGRLILKVEASLGNAVPNLSLKVTVDTPYDFISLAVDTALKVGKPYFVNHDLLSNGLGDNYGISSCFNTLQIGGGSHTLVRLNLKELARSSKGSDDFFEHTLPEGIECLCNIINTRAKFLVEKSNFFESSFLAREGLIDLSKFTSMAGIYGLFECVEHLFEGKKMGNDSFADDMANKIIEQVHTLLKSYDGAYCNGYGNKIGFHAQSGIDTDRDVTPGVRIRSGEEPAIFEQILLQSKLQSFFDAGVSDIYEFDKTAKQNIPGVVKIIQGAFKNNMKIMAINSNDSELVRVTGYLVKKTDVEKYFEGTSMREDTVRLAGETVKQGYILGRKVRTLRRLQ